MKYLRQFGLIMTATFIAELIHRLIPAPIPASIYGLFLLFLCLQFGLIKLSQIEETGKFLLDIMTLMFVPAAVGLIDSWVALRDLLVPALLLIFAGTALTMGATGGVAQLFSALQERKEK